MAKEKCRFKSAVIRPRTMLWTIAKSRYIWRISRLFIRDLQAVVDNYDYNRVDIADIHGW